MTVKILFHDDSGNNDHDAIELQGASRAQFVTDSEGFTLRVSFPDRPDEAYSEREIFAFEITNE